MARTPANWGNRPVCNTPAELLVWLDRQADRHLSVLRPDRCKVVADGANTGTADVTYRVSPEAILEHQRICASDILYAHDWLDANPIPGIPERPVGLESEADGSEAMTERIVAEYSKLRRALAAVGPAEGATETSLGAEEKAIAALVAHPEWSDTKIAEHAGCHRTSLYRWPLYVAAREAQQSSRQERPRADQL